MGKAKAADDAPARHSKYAKAVDQRHKAAERLRAQKYGKQFNRLLRERAPAILAHLEAMPADCFGYAKLSAIVPALFVDYRFPMGVPHDARHHGAFLAYLLTRHELSPADVAEMGDGELLDLLIEDMKGAIHPRGRKRKEQTTDERRIIESYQCQNRPHKEIARELSLPRNLVTKTIRTLQTRIRRERLKVGQ